MISVRLLSGTLACGADMGGLGGQCGVLPWVGAGRVTH